TKRTEYLRSMNGGDAPRETVEERVVRDDSQGKVIERIVRRYDDNGAPAPLEKSVVEEQKRADGGSTVRTTTFRADLNGTLAVERRSIEQTSNTGAGSTSDIVVERPSINGGFETSERRTVVVQKRSDGDVQDTAVFLRDHNGQFYQAS